MQRLRLDLDRLRPGPGGNRDLGRGPRWEFLTGRPSWADATRARYLLAAALAVLAAVLTLRGDPGTHRTEVVVAAHDLAPGRTLTAGDLRRVSRPAGTLPAGALHEMATVQGGTLTAAMRDGEVFTDLRVVGPRLAAVVVGGPDARIVPIHLADSGVADILRAGDRVDVVAAEPGADGGRTTPPVLATDAVVVLVAGAEPGTDPPRSRGPSARILLIALDGPHAAAVAAASLRTALTVVFH
jgi:Flp pilus assembly protein CpaB